MKYNYNYWVTVHVCPNHPDGERSDLPGRHFVVRTLRKETNTVWEEFYFENRCVDCSEDRCKCLDLKWFKKEKPKDPAAGFWR